HPALLALPRRHREPPSAGPAGRARGRVPPASPERFRQRLPGPVLPALAGAHARRLRDVPGGGLSLSGRGRHLKRLDVTALTRLPFVASFSAIQTEVSTPV